MFVFLHEWWWYIPQYAEIRGEGSGGERRAEVG